MNKRNGRTQGPRAGARGGGAIQTAAGERRPRKCPNCNKEHTERICAHPAISVEKRLCWHCNGMGHQANKCPHKGKPMIKAIEDGPANPEPMFVVDDEGYTPVRRGLRPKPQAITLANFIHKNQYETFAERAGAPTHRPASSGSSGRSSGTRPPPARTASSTTPATVPTQSRRALGEPIGSPDGRSESLYRESRRALGRL